MSTSLLYHPGKGDRVGRKRGQGTFLLTIAGVVANLRAMPRAARDSLGGYCYHVLNRGNARRTVFRKAGDYDAFVQLLREAGERRRCPPASLLFDA